MKVLYRSNLVDVKTLVLGELLDVTFFTALAMEGMAGLSVYEQLEESLQIPGHRFRVGVQPEPGSLQGQIPYIKIPGI